MFDTIKSQKESHGCLYTITGCKWIYLRSKFHPESGKVVVFDDRVWHGAYSRDMRRSLVWNFDIET